jgi:hypothetical protein
VSGTSYTLQAHTLETHADALTQTRTQANWGTAHTRRTQVIPLLGTRLGGCELLHAVGLVGAQAADSCLGEVGDGAGGVRQGAQPAATTCCNDGEAEFGRES